MSGNSKTLVQHEPTINEETLSRIPIPSEAQIFPTRTRQHALKEPCLSSLFTLQPCYWPKWDHIT